MEKRSLRIEIVKRADGAGLLRCYRADGSVTWQKQSERHAVHFTQHDLTHYAVETTLGYRQGFYGLIAAGWDIEDTTGNGAKGPLPDEAGEVESVVGLFDSERSSGTIWTADEFAEFAPRKLTRKLDEASIRAIRSNFCPYLALGLAGVNTIFSVLNTVILRQVPFKHADRLVTNHRNFTVHGKWSSDLHA
jgi:hypothetical protein